MSKSYANIHQLLHDLYVSGGRLSPYADYLARGARRMLDRTTILPSLWRAKVLLGVLESPVQPGVGPRIRDQGYAMDLFILLTDCYEPILDDLLVLSVVEIYAKAQLLRAGYAIHEIATPSSLKKRQKTRPIHVRTLKAAARRGESVTFRVNTVGISVLLEKEYRSHYGLPDRLMAAVSGVRQRRNFVHFSEPFGWSLDRDLLDLVEHLHAAVPRAKSRAK